MGSWTKELGFAGVEGAGEVGAENMVLCSGVVDTATFLSLSSSRCVHDTAVECDAFI